MTYAHLVYIYIVLFRKYFLWDFANSLFFLSLLYKSLFSFVQFHSTIFCALLLIDIVILVIIIVPYYINPDAQKITIKNIPYVIKYRLLLLQIGSRNLILYHKNIIYNNPSPKIGIWNCNLLLDPHSFACMTFV